MATESDIWEIERAFWLDGVNAYHAYAHAAAIMVFPDPSGILVGPEILRGLELAPRWSHVAFEGQTSTTTDETLVLAYRALAEREGEAPYRALCCSTYAREGHRWALIAHQQTPVQPGS
ncbi:nuclear transport factor 2 family protein [Aquicoccus sp. SCR17]|nr:nuclear transport factor 2 family protein [Carideicomes alvinocaridis]